MSNSTMHVNNELFEDHVGLYRLAIRMVKGELIELEAKVGDSEYATDANGKDFIRIRMLASVATRLRGSSMRLREAYELNQELLRQQYGDRLPMLREAIQRETVDKLDNALCDLQADYMNKTKGAYIR